MITVLTDCGTEEEFESVAEAEQGKQTHVDLCGDCDESDVEITTDATADGGEVASPEVEDVDAEIIDHTETADELPDEMPIDEDPVEFLPSHFVDQIQGVPTVNRKGYCVIASKYGIEVTAQPETLPSETDFEYAEFSAVAITPDGQQYTGFGSAHVDRQDGDDKYLLAELAETRAMKRAVAWASGIGMTAMSEMKGEL